MIKFNEPAVLGTELDMISQAIMTRKLCGDGVFTKKCEQWLEENYKSKKALLTPSCTDALNLAAMLIDIEPGDEVIMPSFTFTSSANAFVLRGAKIVFVDIRPDTMNIDEHMIETAITDKTKAVLVVHYAGVACEMDKIMELANQYGFYVIEDAAQGIDAKYKGKYLGTIGHLGCYSFHETKNVNCGEGGALLINDESFVNRAEILREKGTNRAMFLRGEIDKYTWVDKGALFLLGELSAAFLYAQLLGHELIFNKRVSLWNMYYELLLPVAECGKIELPRVPQECSHNAHIFFIKCKDIEERTQLAQFLRQNDISAVFHYVPLHSAPAGKKFSIFCGEDKYTTQESDRLLRMPMHYNISDADVLKTVECIETFYK